MNKKRPEGSECGEWVIIELQGDLKTKSQAASLNGKFVGDLHFTKKNEPVLIIGHHILYGKVATLERPFVVVKKCRSDQYEDNLQDDDSIEPMDVPGTGETEYHVKAIIRKKIRFKTRPKPIIANVPKKI